MEAAWTERRTTTADEQAHPALPDRVGERALPRLGHVDGRPVVEHGDVDVREIERVPRRLAELKARAEQLLQVWSALVDATAEIKDLQRRLHGDCAGQDVGRRVCVDGVRARDLRRQLDEAGLLRRDRQGNGPDAFARERDRRACGVSIDAQADLNVRAVGSDGNAHIP